MPQFGSTTMRVMLQEAELALTQDFKIDWNVANHEQFVYCRDKVVDQSGKEVVDYKWSILATRPDDASDRAWAQRRKLLESLHMHPPSAADLGRPDRRVLDSYLANGLGIPLHDKQAERSSSGKPFDFEIGTLPLIDQKQFVLTLDFAIKMLCINERIECRVPCIMEGETGVSKTALTRMLFSLRNSAGMASTVQSQLEMLVDSVAKELTCNELGAVELGVLRKLCELFQIAVDQGGAPWSDPAALATLVCSGDNHAIAAQKIISELRADLCLDNRSPSCR